MKGRRIAVWLGAIALGLISPAQASRGTLSSLSPSILAELAGQKITVRPVTDPKAIPVTTAISFARGAMPGVGTAPVDAAALVDYSDVNTRRDAERGTAPTPFVESWAVAFFRAREPLVTPIGVGGKGWYLATAVVFIDARTGAMVKGLAWGVK